MDPFLLIAQTDKCGWIRMNPNEIMILALQKNFYFGITYSLSIILFILEKFSHSISIIIDYLIYWNLYNSYILKIYIKIFIIIK